MHVNAHIERYEGSFSYSRGLEGHLVRYDVRGGCLCEQNNGETNKKELE